MSMKCEVIHDLLPSYIDELTSEVSNELIKTHLSDCTSCNEMYNAMKQEIPNTTRNPDVHFDTSEKKIVKKIKSKIMTVVSTLIITFFSLGVFIGIFGNVLFQEGNPIPLISSMIKLQFTDKEYVEFSSDPPRYISKDKSAGDRYLVVKKYMSEHGWEFKEQMGSGLIFAKDKEQIVVETRQYTRKFFVWSVPEEDTSEILFN